ncbi:MAG: hypothetical protein K0V04_32545 [Deltaproteobacteria bacterium]|nr:hypothetical protein [Deltaproteobacteria bacterium]
MTARATLLCALGTLALLVPACKKDSDEAKGDDKGAKADGGGKKGDGGETKEAGDEGEPTLQVADGDEGAEGPVPPETSAVFFHVEGALIPLACFDKDKGTVSGGTDCLKLVPEGADVRVSGGDQAFNKKSGERAEPRCMVGSGKKVALGADGLSGGAEFAFGAWPPSALKMVKVVSGDSTSPAETDIDEDILAKIKKKVPVSGTLSAHQVAEVDVDGNDKKDVVYSVFVPHPKMAERYKWSGAFLARDGSLDDLILLGKSRSKKDVFEVMGLLDIDGTGNSELWMRQIFEEGSGDAVLKLEGNTASPLAKWSCGI